MAPEVYQFNRFNFKVDVWALGLIFAYTLSRGKHPYGDDPDLRTVRIKQNEPMLMTETDLMGTSKKYRAIKLIESMLMVEPAKRPLAKDILKDRFFLNEDEVIKTVNLCAYYLFIWYLSAHL